MAKHMDHEVAYYYDSNPTEEDLVPESTLHARLVHYLMEVLQWHLHEQLCSIYENLGFYQTFNPDEKPLAPDIALVKGVAFQLVKSWKVGTTGPAPQVVVEIASTETWDKDLDEKPRRYAVMGVEEYFAYDPNEQLVKKDTTSRLFGWQRDRATGLMRAMTLNLDGSLWSTHLESFLVPGGQYLRLYDSNGHLRLTGEEAEAEAKLAEARRADAEKRRADAEVEAKLVEKRRADAEARRAEALAEKLRSLGIDPNQI